MSSVISRCANMSVGLDSLYHLPKAKFNHGNVYWKVLPFNYYENTVNINSSINSRYYAYWDGIVLGAPCNCTAGLGESCSHVSAVLFKVWQHNHEREEEIAVTSKKCKWATPSEQSLKRVEYQQGKDIIFNNTQQGKKENSSKGHSAIPPAFPSLTPAEQAQLYSDLSKSSTQEGQIVKPAILSVVREYAASYVAKAVMLDLPEPLTNLYNKQARDDNLAQLQGRSETLFEHLTVTKEQVKHYLGLMKTIRCICWLKNVIV